jgi:hypothetical protein
MLGYNDSSVTNARKRLRVGLSGFAASIAVIALAVFLIAAGCNRRTDTTQLKPKECIACHTKEGNWEEHQIEAHGKLDCQVCHSITAKHYQYGETEATEGRSPEERFSRRLGKNETGAKWLPERPVAIKENECRRCHPVVMERSVGHGMHAGIEGITCMACHGGRIHKYEPPADACKSCHWKVVAVSSGMAKVHCTSCHGFQRDESDARHTLIPSREACLLCHKRAQPEIGEAVIESFFTDPKHSELGCGSCHKPHSGRDARAEHPCRSCHTTESLVGIPPHNWEFHLADCTACHQPHNFSPEAAVEGEPVYLSLLHGDKPGNGKRKFRAGADGKIDGSDCNSCHAFGGYVQSVAAVGHPQCAQCHSQSTFAYLGDRATCSRCHTLQTAAFSSAHRDCQRCHSGHAWSGASQQICSKCHSAIASLTAAIPEKAACSTCHSPHAAGSPALPESCRGCHGSEVDESAGIAAKRDCSACHPTHEWKYRAGSCATCHQVISASSSEAGAFKSDCTNCHQPHTWAAPDDSCALCHSDVVEQILPELAEVKSDCSMCHETHKWKADMATCGMCHSDALEDVALIERLRYEKLREQLAAEDRLDELPDMPAPFAKRDCSMCHEAHVWRIDTDVFDCTVCHSSVESGLHSVEGHNDCSTCHGGHRWKPAGRDLCAMCHTDKDEHYVGTDCVDCHWEIGAGQ